MRKYNFTIYALFLVNLAYVIRHGFHWLFGLTAALTLAMLALDIVEAIRKHE